MKSSEIIVRITRDNVGEFLEPDQVPAEFTEDEVRQVNAEIAEKARTRVTANQSGGIPGVAIRRPSLFGRLFALGNRSVFTSRRIARDEL